MRTIELLLGGIIVVPTLVDIFQSVVVPRPTRGSLRLAPFLLDGMWPLWKWIALRFPSAKHRAAFLGIYAPLTVVMLLLVWGLAPAASIKVYQTDGNANDDPWTQINDELQHILNDNSEKSNPLLMKFASVSN